MGWVSFFLPIPATPNQRKWWGGCPSTPQTVFRPVFPSSDASSSCSFHPVPHFVRRIDSSQYLSPSSVVLDGLHSTVYPRQRITPFQATVTLDRRFASDDSGNDGVGRLLLWMTLARTSYRSNSPVSAFQSPTADRKHRKSWCSSSLEGSDFPSHPRWYSSFVNGRALNSPDADPQNSGNCGVGRDRLP
jgi:hypothetical protein